MNEANLTRFGPLTLRRDPATDTQYTASFRAIEGPARLRLRGSELDPGRDGVQILVNGHPVAEARELQGKGGNTASSGTAAGAPPAHPADHSFELPLDLLRENTIEIVVPAGPAGECSVRITQVVQADLGLLRQGYFGLNTSDMARQRAFYGTLGFTGEIFPAGPETSTTFARALGFADNYLIHVALTSLEDPPAPPFVDTVQFRGDSYRDEPPYARLNHLGMTYATYATNRLDDYVAALAAQGVTFVSAPARAPDGERFVFLKDQDGTFLKLVEQAGDATTRPGLVRLLNTNMNVSDLERSREFYRLLGFTVSAPASMAGDGAFAAAHGFDGPIAFEGVDVSLGEGTDGATLQLRQWLTPYDDAPPYPPPVNHLGIDRINFYLKDLTAAIRTMTDLGFEPMGPIGGGPEFGLVFFLDPDGIKVQIAGPRTDQPVAPPGVLRP